MIEFLCPNGHRIHCPDEQAGRAAKCPRCGVKFRIPSTAELQAPESLQPDSTVSDPQLTDSGVRGSSSKVVSRPAEKEPQIEFLCPNGHHLHGPASLQGRPGECPECGSRFRIPVIDEPAKPAAAAPSAQQSPEAPIEPISLDGGGLEVQQFEPAIETPVETAADVEEVLLPSPAERSSLRSVAQRWPEVFARLWAAKAEGGRIEVHLEGGEVVAVDRLAQSLSQQGHAILATKEADGTYTVTAVAWDRVARVVVRGVRDLPPEMSGE